MSSYDTYRQNGAGERVPTPFPAKSVRRQLPKKHGESLGGRYCCTVRHCRQASKTVQRVSLPGARTESSAQRRSARQSASTCVVCETQGLPRPLGASSRPSQSCEEDLDVGKCTGALFLSASSSASITVLNQVDRVFNREEKWNVLCYFWVKSPFFCPSFVPFASLCNRNGLSYFWWFHAAFNLS